MGRTNFDELEINKLILHQEYEPDGDISITGDVEATGDATFGGILDVTGPATLRDSLSVLDDVSVTGAIAASGDVSGATGTFGKISLSGVSAIAIDDATSTASSTTVDPNEFAAVVTLLNACKAKINAIIAGS